MNLSFLRARAPRVTRLAVGFMLVFGLLATTAVLAPAYAVPSYPSQAEVNAAKKKVSAKRAMIARLDKIIADQNAEADRLSTIALIKGEKFNQAQDAVDVIAAKVKVLQGEADAANEQADQAKMQLGQLAAQMYRNGASGTTLNLLLNASEADDLLYQLGQSEKIAQQSDTIYKKSIEKQKYAQSLTDALAVAKTQLAEKAKVAQAAFDAATSAANAVESELAKSKEINRTLYAQLAFLQNSSAELERQRAEGLAAEIRQNQGSADLTAPELYNVSDADPEKVAVAINFAKRQLGEWYVLGGIGPNVWDCSGITKASYAAAGIYIGTHSATNQFNTMAAEQKLIPLSARQTGDLMWYTKESQVFNGDKYHVVMYLGANMMLEAPRPGATVRIVSVRWGEMFRYAGRPSAN
jgi:cell wall-associated NlpC family hydrolase